MFAAATDLPLLADPELDLMFERTIDIAPELVWKAWTEPAHLMPWFCPLPWRTTECEIDLRPGGKFRTVMVGPAGERHDNIGCYLEVTENRQLVWTSALGPGFRPTGNTFMTAIIRLEPVAQGTRYMALARHMDAATRQQHEAMGFREGWGTALDQLVAYMKQQAAS